MIQSGTEKWRVSWWVHCSSAESLTWIQSLPKWQQTNRISKDLNTEQQEYKTARPLHWVIQDINTPNISKKSAFVIENLPEKCVLATNFSIQMRKSWKLYNNNNLWTPCSSYSSVNPSFSSSSIWKLSKSPLVLLGSSPTLCCSKLFWSRSSLLVEKTHSRIEHKIICFQHFVSFLPKRKVSNVAFPAFDRESVYTIVYSL